MCDKPEVPDNTDNTREEPQGVAPQAPVNMFITNTRNDSDGDNIPTPPPNQSITEG